MNIRQEVEKTLLAYASAKIPKIPVAFEAVPFTKPSTGNWLELMFLEPVVINPTVDVLRTRKYGIIQINCCVPDGQGMKALDQLTEEIVALFPVHDKTKFHTFTVEQTPKISSSFPDDKFRVAVVRVKYRQEIKTI